ncbi:hypothetical protein HRbin36_02320 [bacterium HR36]|nr:hypothetical protein HRbin36_02320 [bacterium HR36]
MTDTVLSRRKFLWQAGAAVSGLAVTPSLLFAEGKPSAAQFAQQYRDAQWQAWHLNEFLDLISDTDRWVLKLSLGLEGNKTKGRLRGHAADIDDILEELLWNTSHICCYWFRDEWSIAYHHDVVVWCARKLRWALGMPAIDADRSTFELEHDLLVYVFLRLWNRLSEQQRAQLLQACVELSNDPKARAKQAAQQGKKAAEAVRELQNHWLLKRAPMLEKALKRLGIAAIYQLLAGGIQRLTATSAILLPCLPPIDKVSKILALLWRVLQLLNLGSASAAKTLPFVLTLHCIKVEHQLQAGILPAQLFPPAQAE